VYRAGSCRKIIRVGLLCVQADVLAQAAMQLRGVNSLLHPSINSNMIQPKDSLWQPSLLYLFVCCVQAEVPAQTAMQLCGVNSLIRAECLSGYVQNKRSSCNPFRLTFCALPFVCCVQAEVPAQPAMQLRGVNGFMPYKSAAELIKHSMVG
jgi:hypothetical protein